MWGVLCTFLPHHRIYPAFINAKAEENSVPGVSYQLCIKYLLHAMELALEESLFMRAEAWRKEGPCFPSMPPESRLADCGPLFQLASLDLHKNPVFQ